jgi:hypothetical protein
VNYRLLLLPAAGCLLLAACVELPTEPTVAVMPPPYKPFEVFQADEQACKAYAGQVVAQPEGNDTYYYYPQYRFNIAYEQCMYSRGNQVPGFGAAPSAAAAPEGMPPPNQPPPPPH